jgi:hypothetical protein
MLSFNYPFQKHAFFLLPISKTCVCFTGQVYISGRMGSSTWRPTIDRSRQCIHLATYLKNMRSFCATLWFCIWPFSDWKEICVNINALIFTASVYKRIK